MPTDEEYLATARRALMALEADLDVALKSGHRGHILEIARQMRELGERAVQAVGEDGADPILVAVHRARERATKAYGTAAWDEPMTIEQAKERMALHPSPPAPGSEPPPLTDEELAAVARGENWRDATCRECGRTVIVTPDLSTFTCHCPSLQPPTSVKIDDPSPLRPYVETRSGPTAAERLVAEVRRLRSDSWLVDAANEWARAHDAPSSAHHMAAELLAILRKHRDGKA